MRKYAVIPIGSIVAVQALWTDCGLWTLVTKVGKGDHKHNDRSYTIQVTDRMADHQEQEACEANPDSVFMDSLETPEFDVSLADFGIAKSCQ